MTFKELFLHAVENGVENKQIMLMNDQGMIFVYTHDEDGEIVELVDIQSEDVSTKKIE